MKAVMVTTEQRGVFFGYVGPKAKTDGKTITLKNARMCVFWSTAMRGVLGLASMGPDKACRIGPSIPSIILQNVTSVCEVSKGAVEKWEAAPWTI